MINKKNLFLNYEINEMIAKIKLFSSSFYLLKG